MEQMGYYRFRNTLDNLADCREHMDDRDLLREEEGAKGELVALCIRILEDLEDVNKQ